MCNPVLYTGIITTSYRFWLTDQKYCLLVLRSFLQGHVLWGSNFRYTIALSGIDVPHTISGGSGRNVSQRFESRSDSLHYKNIFPGTSMCCVKRPLSPPWSLIEPDTANLSDIFSAMLPECLLIDRFVIVLCSANVNTLSDCVPPP
jgi:hypothetical protein